MSDLLHPVLACDPAAAEHFVELLDGGAVAVTRAVGHRTRLFDVMATLPPSTSAAIADAAGLAEHHLRALLAYMVTGRIVPFDPAAATDPSPPDHAAI